MYVLWLIVIVFFFLLVWVLLACVFPQVGKAILELLNDFKKAIKDDE